MSDLTSKTSHAGADVADETQDLARQTLERQTINTVKTLAMDAVQQANSGHPGTPMGLAPLAYALWKARPRFQRNT